MRLASAHQDFLAPADIVQGKMRTALAYAVVRIHEQLPHLVGPEEIVSTRQERLMKRLASAAIAKAALLQERADRAQGLGDGGTGSGRPARDGVTRGQRCCGLPVI